MALVTALSLLLAGCGVPLPTATRPPTAAPAGRTPLVVFAAGSLIIPFSHLEAAFEARYPEIDVQAEYHGSIQVMRHVSELHEPIDVVATADAALIPMLMYAAQNPETGQPYGNWYIRFASNRLALAYTANSRYAEELNAENWYEILARTEVRVGLSDPRFDALGYRMLMAYALANAYYGQPKLFINMFNGRFVSPVTIFQDDELTTINVPEIVETRPETGLILRGGSIQLLALLEAGEIDYAFEYESVIQQHGLKMLSLPEALNLGSATQDYSHVQVTLDFQRFSSLKPQFTGERIGYGITIPSNAPHPEAAEKFIAFLLSAEGRAVLEKDYHPLFDPAICDGQVNMPASLQGVCAPGGLADFAPAPLALPRPRGEEVFGGNGRGKASPIAPKPRLAEDWGYWHAAKPHANTPSPNRGRGGWCRPRPSHLGRAYANPPSPNRGRGGAPGT
jgi:molybdate/tungstate transport system substrate-binding protein